MKPQPARKPSGSALTFTESRVSPQSEAREFVTTFANGLAVIQAFSDEFPALTLSEVAQRTGLTRASARRYLHTLETLGFAERGANRTFVLSPKVLTLGHAYLTSMPMWRFSEPVLEQLVEQLGETCSLSMLDDVDVIYVLRIPVRRILDRISTVGSRLPAYCTSMGRLLLAALSDRELDHYLETTTRIPYTDKTLVHADDLRAHLEQVRRLGYAWVSGEVAEHISGLAVPVYDKNARVIAALTVSVRRTHIDSVAFIQRTLPALRKAANRLSSSMIVYQKHAAKGVRRDHATHQ